MQFLRVGFVPLFGDEWIVFTERTEEDEAQSEAAAPCCNDSNSTMQAKADIDIGANRSSDSGTDHGKQKP